MKKYIFILSLMLMIINSANAEWHEEKINHITNEIKQTGIQWSRQQTVELLREAQNTGNYNTTIFTDHGMVRITILGEAFLLNGKDISGNLGSKITHGDNSPIIENVQNSNITTGENSPINSSEKLTNEVSGESQVNVGDNNSIDNKTNNFTLNITLSVTLSLSLILNFYFIRKIQKRKKQPTNGSTGRGNIGQPDGQC